MTKKIFLNLTLTLISSIIITGIIFFIWSSLSHLNFEETQAQNLFFVGLTIFQNIVIAIFTLPIAFQINTENYFSVKTKMLYTLASPVLTTSIFVFLMFSNIDLKFIFSSFVAPVIFVLLNFYFYFRLENYASR